MSNYLLIKEANIYRAHPIPGPGESVTQIIQIPCTEVDRIVDRYRDDPLLAGPVEREAIFIHNNRAHIRVNFDQIMWIEASRSYCNFHMENGKIYTETLPLAEVGQHLPHDRFLRIHRSYMVNIQFVESFCGNEAVIGKARLPIGNQYKKEIDEHFLILRGSKRR